MITQSLHIGVHSLQAAVDSGHCWHRLGTGRHLTGCQDQNAHNLISSQSKTPWTPRAPDERLWCELNADERTSCDSQVASSGRSVSSCVRWHRMKAEKLQGSKGRTCCFTTTTSCPPGSEKHAGASLWVCVCVFVLTLLEGLRTEEVVHCADCKTDWGEVMWFWVLWINKIWFDLIGFVCIFLEKQTFVSPEKVHYLKRQILWLEPGLFCLHIFLWTRFGNYFGLNTQLCVK